MLHESLFSDPSSLHVMQVERLASDQDITWKLLLWLALGIVLLTGKTWI
jgi:hypothetical protein